MITNIKSTYRLIRVNLKRLLLLEVIYKIFFFFLIVPFISLAFNVALSYTRYSYITSENIFGFILYPQTIIALLLVLAVVAIFLQIEASSLFFLFEDCKSGENHNFAQLMIAGVHSMFSLIRRKCFFVPIYTILIAFFLNIPMILLVVTKASIPSYLMKAFLSLDYAKSILFTVLIILMILCYRRIFVLPLCVLDKKSYHDAKRISVSYMKGCHLKLIGQLIGINMILFILYVLIYSFCLGLLALGIYLFTERNTAIGMFLQNYEQLNRILYVLLSVLGMIVNYLMISQLYVRANKPTIKETEIVHKKGKSVKVKLSGRIRKQVKNVMLGISLLCGITMYSYFYNSFRNGNFAVEEALLGMQITAHRGYSEVAPENTIPAIEAAIETYSDYTEIDVQLTKDGTVVIYHDLNLYRTSGARTKIIDITYEELCEYDVGSWFSNEYVGTKVPTLAEVLDFCKGKVKLNIEIKRINNQQELVDKVVDLIGEYEFERQCVVTSMSYEALKMVKERNSEIKTGYIMSIAYGNFYENANIDFFSMKASMITEDVVKRAHTLGKEVHAWTVNSRNEILRLHAIGTDNIITDRPVFVQEVLYDSDNTSILQYIKMILK